MNIKSFVKLVELPTKVASVIPFIVGIVYTIYRYNTFSPLRIGLFFISLICIDMSTTAINNYMDYKRAVHKKGYNYEQHNAIVRDELSEKQVKWTIALLLTVSAIAGLLLVQFTDLVVFCLGVFAFMIGILYSFGPIPISRTPFGELFSGVVMGGLIFFITVYAQVYDLGLIFFHYANGNLELSFNLPELLTIVLLSVPMVFCIANIMLANNICDIEDDTKNKRYTLPRYIGKEKAIILFDSLTYLSYLGILISVILGLLPLTTLLVLITIIPIRKGLKAFHIKQTKKDTFIIAVKNFILINGSYGIMILAGVSIKWLIG